MDGSIQVFDNATCPDTCNKTREDSTEVFCRCKRGDSRDDSDNNDEDVVIRKRRGLRFGERRDGRSRDGISRDSESGRQRESRRNRNGDSGRQRDGRRGGRRGGKKEPCGIIVDGSIQVFDNATCPDTCNKTHEDSTEVFCQCRGGAFEDYSESDSDDDNRNNGNDDNDEDVVVIRKRRGLRFGERRDGRSRDGESGRQRESRGNRYGDSDRQRWQKGTR